MLRDGAPTYDEWLDGQDYTYDSTSAAVYDYFDEAVDFDELDRVVYGGTRFLDNVIDMSEFPLDEITEKVGQMRKIGLGVMGWAQMLYQMGIRYGSDESLHMGRILMNYIDERATKVSHTLAEERGSFPAWDKSKYADPEAYPDWFRAHAYELPEAYAKGYEMRNHNVTTVAPTGTTSMIGDTSGGIEPVFSVAYMKNVGEDIQGDSMLVEFDKVFIRALEHNEAELDHTVEEIKEIAAQQMKNNEFDGVQGLPIPQWMKDTFVTTNDLTSREHGLMQRVFQDGVDSGISKTVNLPKEATHKDVHDAYMLALSHDELGASIKGLTVYRDQSREVQVLTTQEYSDLEVSNAVEMLEDLGYMVTEPEGGDK
jgi:ribonucleoside-diphosphate reductase alpha chain